MSMERVLEGVDAARRAGWAKAFAAEAEAQSLNNDLEQARRERDYLQSTINGLERRLEAIEALCTCDAHARYHYELLVDERRIRSYLYEQLELLRLDPRLSFSAAQTAARQRGVFLTAMFRPAWRQYQQNHTP